MHVFDARPGPARRPQLALPHPGPSHSQRAHALCTRQRTTAEPLAQQYPPEQPHDIHVRIKHGVRHFYSTRTAVNSTRSLHRRGAAAHAAFSLSAPRALARSSTASSWRWMTTSLGPATSASAEGEGCAVSEVLRRHARRGRGCVARRMAAARRRVVARAPSRLERHAPQLPSRALASPRLSTRPRLLALAF